MQFVFGSGLLFAQPQGFDNQAANTPLQVGAIQGVTVDFGFNAKELNAGKWPLAIGRGTGKISCKADWAAFSARGFNAIFFGGSEPPVGRTCIAVDEPHTVSANAVTPDHAGTFLSDWGVVAALPSSAPYERVASSPSGRQYTCNESSGAYGFGGVNGETVLVNYAYADAANGRKIDLPNRISGHTPRFSAVLTETFNGKRMTLTLPVCVAGKITLTSKIDNFMIPQFSFSAGLDDSDSGNVGTLSVEEGADTTRYLIIDLLLHFGPTETDSGAWKDWGDFDRGIDLIPNQGAIEQDTGPFGGAVTFNQAHPGSRSPDYYSGVHSEIRAGKNIDFGSDDFVIDFVAALTNGMPTYVNDYMVYDVKDAAGNGFHLIFQQPIEADPEVQCIFSIISTQTNQSYEVRVGNIEANVPHRYRFSRKGRALTSFRDGVVAQHDATRFQPGEVMTPASKGYIRIGAFDFSPTQHPPQLIQSFNGKLAEMYIAHGSAAGWDANFPVPPSPFPPP